MNFKFDLTTTKEERMTIWPENFDERVNKLPLSVQIEIGHYYDCTYNFKFVWHLNSSINGLIESVDVYVNSLKVKAEIVPNDEDYITIDIYLEDTVVRADILYYPSYEHCKLESLGEIYISNDNNLEEMIYKNHYKAATDKIINDYVSAQESEKQAFIEYAYSMNVRYWAEQNYFGGFVSSRNSYVFSATKEWLEEKQKDEFIDDSAWYHISAPRPIEEFPYWRKAFEQKSSQEVIKRLFGLESSLIWFKDRGSIFTNDL